MPPGCSLIINIGTTTEAIAHELLHHKGLRVITNNLNVAAILSDNPDCEVIVAGGIVRSRDRGIVGEATVDFIRQFKVDIGLIGISGIEADGTPARLRLPRGEGGARDHRALARGLARRRPQQVQPAGDGRAGAPRRDRHACSPTRPPPAPFPELLAEAGVQLHHLRGAPMTGKTHLLALDQGTSSSRSIVFDATGRIVAMAQREFRQIFPQPGWVEHDPREIWESQLATAREALAEAGVGAGDIAAIGITNQRETTLLWNRAPASRSPTPSSGRTGAPRRRARR